MKKSELEKLLIIERAKVLHATEILWAERGRWEPDPEPYMADAEKELRKERVLQ